MGMQLVLLLTIACCALLASAAVADGSPSLQSRRPRYLLLGAATYPRLSKCQLGVWLRSAVRHLADVDIVIGVDPTVASIMPGLVNDTVAAGDVDRNNIRIIIQRVTFSVRAALSRWTWYGDVIAERRQLARYSAVLMTDTKDVVFQANPFPELAASRAVVVAEEFRMTIAQQESNRRWMTELGRLDEFGDRMVLCSGVAGGAVFPMTRFLAAMRQEMIAHPSTTLGIDQGLFQLCVYSRPRNLRVRIDNTTVRPLFWHLGLYMYARTFPFRFDGDRLLGEDGRPPPVVHQYDRQDTNKRRFYDLYDLSHCLIKK
eukprot:TRINITY_DN9654_c0_g1_i1.p1 TRINITY_DN9654_c0_g1~~TRINITY_DN9654_c0_g1_i1.p1  ORF type:complete len:315 (-),score=64.90 TRINITY_DN9654_c0_g1_i1:89-1033(-)